MEIIYGRQSDVYWKIIIKHSTVKGKNVEKH